MIYYILAVVIALAVSLLVIILSNKLPSLSGETDPAKPDDSVISAPETKETIKVFSLRNILVIIGLISFSIYGMWRVGFSAGYVTLMVYFGIFALIAVIDIEHRLILDVVMIPAFIFALVELPSIRRIKLLDGLTGYAIAQIIVLGFYLLGVFYLRLVNRRRPDDQQIDEIAFGFGDVTLATFGGLVVGYPRVVPMLVIMVLVGGINAVIFGVIQAVARKKVAHAAFPYGPSIIVATLIMMLWGEAVGRLLGAP